VTVNHRAGDRKLRLCCSVFAQKDSSKLTETEKCNTVSIRLLHSANMSSRGYTLSLAWEDAISEWLAWLCLQGFRDTTLRTRRGQVRAIARRSGTRHPREIDLGVLVALCGRPGLSADHRHGQHAALTSFYSWCVDNGVVGSSPAALLPKVKAGSPRPRPATDQIWSDLLNAAAPRETLMALLACEAGLRRAEVAGLHFDDLTRDLDGWCLIIRGKGDKQRVVPINVRLANALRIHCHGGYVFPGQDGGHLSPDCVGRLISRLMPDGWTMHKLRHRYATRGFNGTHNLLAVQQALGHSSVATTQRYTAVNLIDVRAVSDAAAQQDWMTTEFS
jgi:integrase